MALWEAGGGFSPAPADEIYIPHDTPYYVGGKRRVSHSDGSDFDPDWPPINKRPKIVGPVGVSHKLIDPSASSIDSLPFREVAFFVRACHSAPLLDPSSDREFDTPEPEPAPVLLSIPLPVPEIEKVRKVDPDFDYASDCAPGSGPAKPVVVGGGTGGCSMERTASGLSISPAATCVSVTDADDPNLFEDLEAARLVREHLDSFGRRSRNTQHERILRTLINPKNREAEFPIDNAALESIFSAANEIFFFSRLSQRVTWDWSHESASQYQSQVIGTTAFRRSKLGGYETLIVLSKPILMSVNFSRRLLISTFLHELIHSYLFIVCGFKARHCGGHTEGFHQIAAMIDHWAGPEHLRLQEMEADLESYRAAEPSPSPAPSPQRVAPQQAPPPQSQHPSQWNDHYSESRQGDVRETRHVRYGNDNGTPQCAVLRLQPHRLPQAQREQVKHHHHHHHHHYHHYHHPYHYYQVREELSHNGRRDGVWEEYIEDRWHG